MYIIARSLVCGGKSKLITMFFVTRATMLRPSEITQRETLAAAIAELLWKVGEGRRAILAIPEANPVFEASVRFSMDGLTEKVSE